MKLPWQRSTPAGTAASDARATSSQAGKGRPTPTRKEAEAARKQSLRVPNDPKEAKKAARARTANERAVQRAALMSGDESALPARDAGPLKSHVRDYIDGRFAAAELFLPLAVIVLVLGFVPLSTVKAAVTVLWLGLTMLIVVDTTVIMIRLSGDLKRRWPDKADRKGAILYAIMRVLQFRKLRLPPPKVRRNGQPVMPKQPKEPTEIHEPAGQ